MDLDKIAKTLDLDVGNLGTTQEGLVVQGTYKETSTKTKPARVKEMSYSMKVTPKNTYSSVEYTQTVEILDATSEQVSGIREALKRDVLTHATKAAEELIIEMQNKGMI